MPHPLRRLRDAKGLSLRKLAARTHIHYTKLSHLEHGREPRPDELRRLARALGVKPRDLRESGSAEHTR